MKLTETIDECIKIVEAQIETYKKCSETVPKEWIPFWTEKDIPKMKEEWQEEIIKWGGHLQNLKFIKYEIGLELYKEEME